MVSVLVQAVLVIAAAWGMFAIVTGWGHGGER